MLKIQEQVVHLKAIDRRQRDLLQPGSCCLSREGLGWHLPLHVVASEHVPDFVNEPSSCLANLLAERRQPAILLIRRGSDVDLSQTANRLAVQEPVPVDPQQLAERRGVASVGLALLSVVRLNQDYLVASVVLQHTDQPIIEATDFEHSDKQLAFP